MTCRLSFMDHSAKVRHHFIPLKSLPIPGVIVDPAVAICYAEYLQNNRTVRHQTFVRSKTWPKEELGADWRVYLAGAGFYHPSNPFGLTSDEIICPSCGLCLVNLRNAKKTRVHRLHEELSATCNHVKRINYIYNSYYDLQLPK